MRPDMGKSLVYSVQVMYCNKKLGIGEVLHRVYFQLSNSGHFRIMYCMRHLFVRTL